MKNQVLNYGYYKQKEYSETPLVSVDMITYNHEKYIAKAIEGVLEQNLDFKYELVIGEDCSTDRTREICEQYAAKYPEIIKLLPSEKNLGMMENGNRTLIACTGKYIAFCEGDDYWSNPSKLQKQVNFLEKNPKYSAVGHQSAIIYEKYPGEMELFFNYSKDTLTKKDIIYSNVFHTNAILFRKSALDGFYSKNSRPFVEHSIFILIAQSGPFKVFPEIMSVYRKHDYGVAGTSTPEKAYRGQIEWIKEVKEILDWSFFWGYHFLSSRVYLYYALNHPEIFRGGLIKRNFCFIKYAFLTLILYPRNIKSVLRMIPDLIRINLKNDKTVPTV